MVILNLYAQKSVTILGDHIAMIFFKHPLPRNLEFATDNVLLLPTTTKAMNRIDESVGCKERLGGLLKYYHREAA